MLPLQILPFAFLVLFEHGSRSNSRRASAQPGELRRLLFQPLLCSKCCRTPVTSGGLPRNIDIVTRGCKPRERRDCCSREIKMIALSTTSPPPKLLHIRNRRRLLPVCSGHHEYLLQQKYPLYWLESVRKLL